MGEVICGILVAISYLGGAVSENLLAPVVAKDAIRPERIVGLAEGSLVEITTVPRESTLAERFSSRSSEFIVGTVLRARQDRLEMINCERIRQVTPMPMFSNVPVLNRYFKTTGTLPDFIPLMCVPTREIASADVLMESPVSFRGP
ncbi:MAG TPA: hypothetical protein VNQ76_14015 [Planctomicrobium sp.]|nr:hypothetical protein [Planctomicrobium sp.]